MRTRRRNECRAAQVDGGRLDPVWKHLRGDGRGAAAMELIVTAFAAGIAGFAFGLPGLVLGLTLAAWETGRRGALAAAWRVWLLGTLLTAAVVGVVYLPPPAGPLPFWRIAAVRSTDSLVLIGQLAPFGFAVLAGMRAYAQRRSRYWEPWAFALPLGLFGPWMLARFTLNGDDPTPPVVYGIACIIGFAFACRFATRVATLPSLLRLFRDQRQEGWISLALSLTIIGAGRTWWDLPV
ncbi:MAG: hypothetical protein AAF192_03945 [Pseudomonadota bacterium]